ncbi:MAG: tRNA uridine-5-carboxymethylaminomethyl(34) synthesis GTPase MnmE [Steroidobacteraceae bacterium]
MNSEQDTIAAIATPPGRGGVGIIRISGRVAANIAQQLLGVLPSPRSASLRVFRAADNSCIDQGIVLWFPAPHSFTGEDVVELQGHGGPVVLDLLLQRVVQLGARLAEPGEFSKRAFLNDKLDLVEAEAIADLITADSAQAARAALRSLQGEFSRCLHELTEAVITTRLHVEAAIDFPDEALDLLQDQLLLQRMAHAQGLIGSIQQRAQQGSLLREGMTVVIAGKPNAGKSSLLNRLAGYDVAIVTDVPGTTRDVLRERIHLDGLPLHVIDTAGLRDTDDRIEAEGVRRAHAEISKADRLLYVVDASHYDAVALQHELQQLTPTTPVTVILNKVDLLGDELLVVADEPLHLQISAITGQGMELLSSHLQRCMGYNSSESGGFLARRRHLDALQRAQQHLNQAQENLLVQKAGELCAEELRYTQLALSEITGEFTSDDLLGRIFSSFCIGK